MVYLGVCPHRLHVPCYASLQVGAGANLRCPMCRVTVALHESERRVPRQRSDDVMAKVLTTTWQATPAEGELGRNHRGTGGGGGDWFSVFAGAGVKDTILEHIFFSCNVHSRYDPGFVEDAIPLVMSNEARQVTCTNRALHTGHREVSLRLVNRLSRRAVSAGWRTR